MHPDRKSLSKARRIIIKLGSNVLSTDKGLDSRQIGHLATQVARLRRGGRQMVIVTSGAIAAGMARLGLPRRPTHITDLQACAAIGQNLLMANYDRSFRRHGLTVAQILLTWEDFRDPKRCQNARQILLRLLGNGIVPIINENDAVSFEEIKFGENDQLASMVHQLVHADACILLSTVEGFLIPEVSKKGARRMRVLSTIPRITAQIQKQAGGSISQRSVGGMKSKLLAAKRVLSTRKPMVIAHGRTKNVLERLLKGEILGTIFLP